MEGSLKKHKQKWDTLAKDNDRYYVRSVKHEQSDDEFGASGRENVRAFIKKDSTIRERLEPFSDQTVLEIGCGSGRITKSLSADFKRVFAIDISPEMLRKAASFVNASNVHFIESDGASVPVEPESVDFAFSYIVYQHFPSREAVLSSFRGVNRALKAEGLFKTQVRGQPHSDSKHWSWGPDYTAEQGKELAAQSGFKVLSMKGAGSRSFWMLLEKLPTD